MLASRPALASPAGPLSCPACDSGRIGRHDCDRCHGTGHARCECGDAPAVTTSLTDRHVKLCASCAVTDERDVRAWLATTGLPADAITRFFALAPTLTEQQLHELIPLPEAEYVAEIERMVGERRAA